MLFVATLVANGYLTLMDTVFSGNSPPLPAFALYPALALLSALSIFAIWRANSRAARFVIFAIWLRYIMSSAYTVTFATSPLGLTWMALASVGIFVLGLFIVRQRRLLDAALVPLYIFGIAVVLSGVANHNLPGTLNVLIKLGYLGILILAVVDACEDMGSAGFFKLLLWPFTLPLGLQAISFALGISKASEADGSASYIGGYAHEAGLSLILATGLLVTCFADRLQPLVKTCALLACSIGILLSAYRTSIIGMAPLIGVQLLTSATRRFIPEQRALVGGLMAVLVAIAGVAGALLMRDRFSDLAILFDPGTNVIRPPSEFTVEDRGVMNGRPFVWSTYVYAYLNGTQIQHLVGFGPDSWRNVTSVYAHNTLVSNLYELGMFGVAATIFLWAWMFALAIPIRQGPRLRIIAGHLSFLLLNMATMPLWSIEGNILYAILCGYTVWWWRQSRELSESRGPMQELPEGGGRGKSPQPA